jgi:hypothetical protein
MRALALLAGLATAGAAAGLALAIFGAGKEGAPGFVGPGVLIADVNLALELLLVGGLTFGLYLARRGSIEAHRVNQTAWVLVNLALVAFIMAGSMQDVKVEKADDLWNARIVVTWLHAGIGTLTVAAGVWLVLQMNDVLPRWLHVRFWKTLMRMTLAGYWAVAILGLVTYYFWYAG